MTREPLAMIGRGVIGYMSLDKEEDYVSSLMQDLFGGLGSVFASKVKTNSMP